jgi:hypothetical protein
VRRVIYTSEELNQRLIERARVSGVSVSQLACVLLDRALDVYDLPEPASSAEELSAQGKLIAKKVVEGILDLGLLETKQGETQAE